MKLKEIKALVIDMDGVLWRGEQALPGVADFFEFMARNSIRFLVATNNATRTVESYVERMLTIGVAVEPGKVLTSANATARWLRHELPPGAPVLVVGEQALYEALARQGLRPIDPEEPAEADVRAAAVAVGLDRGITYEKLRRAMYEIKGGARFVATNGDHTFPAETGLVPGAGSIVAAVETASNTEPTVIGKPFAPMFETALEVLGTPTNLTAMLGDRLDTDIEGGRSAGLATILVLTGVTTAAEATASPIKADYIFEDLVQLREAWEKALRLD